jgi:hypothetical protein
VALSTILIFDFEIVLTVWYCFPHFIMYAPLEVSLYFILLSMNSLFQKLFFITYTSLSPGHVYPFLIPFFKSGMEVASFIIATI